MESRNTSDACHYHSGVSEGVWPTTDVLIHKYFYVVLSHSPQRCHLLIIFLLDQFAHRK